MAYHPSLWHKHPSIATLASGKLHPSKLLLRLQLPRNQNRPVARLRNLLQANPPLLKFQRQSKIQYHVDCEVYSTSCCISNKQLLNLESLLYFGSITNLVTWSLHWSLFFIILAYFSLFCCTSAYLNHPFTPQSPYLHKLKCLQ